MKRQLIVKSHISEIKRICETQGIEYEIISKPSKKKPKITDQQLKEAYQKLAKSKNYEKEMQLWDALEEEITGRGYARNRGDAPHTA